MQIFCKKNAHKVLFFFRLASLVRISMKNAEYGKSAIRFGA